MAGAAKVEVSPLGPEPGATGFAVLHNRQFRWLYLSNGAFFFAMNGQMIVRSYLAFDITNRNAFALGLINLAVAIPMLIVSPFGGVIADRVEKRRLILIGQAVLMLNELAVLALLLAGRLEFWHLFAVVFVMGCTFPFVMPARQAIVVTIVGRRGLGNAMALQMGAMNAARVVAPALAGFLIWIVGVNATYAVAVVVYGFAFAAMSRIEKSPPPARDRDTSVYHDILEGFRYVAGDPPVRVLMTIGILPMLLAMPFQALLVVFAVDVWDVGSRGLGVLQGAAGLGGMAGAFFLAWRPEPQRKLRLMMASLLGFGSSLFLFALSPWFALGLVMVLIADVFASIFQTVNNTIIQMVIPDAVRGRVMSLMMMTFGLTPLGTVPISALAQKWGAPFAVGAAAVAMVALSLLIYALSRSFRDVDRIAGEAALMEVGPVMPGRRGSAGAPEPM
ncbi:MAG: MFS transporter [Thermoflexaceae bacterium]|nr:MFS transporter [Thermoflexaceae bacterium]